MDEEQTALSVLPGTAISTIIAADKDDILGKLADKVRAFRESRPDVSKPSDREAMRSMAYEIAKTKTSLVKIGKGLTEEWRKSTKAVNEECKIVEDRMDELRDQVRAPLTAWENREKERVAAHEAAFAELVSFGQFPTDWPSGHIATRVTELEESGLASRAWQEFQDRASDTHAEVMDKLRNAHTAALNREAEAAELARLRAEQAERDRIAALEAQAKREAEIAAAAAEQARKDQAAAFARKAEEARQAAQRQLEREQEAARKHIAEQEANAEALRREVQAAEDRMEREKAVATERERLAAEKAERDKQAAIEAERRRVKAEEDAKRAEQDAREADKAHRALIHREIMAGILDAMAYSGAILPDTEVAETFAKAIVTAMAKGKIQHVKVEY